MKERMIGAPEIDERLYELYLNWCRAHNIKPDLSGFDVWLQDNDYEIDNHYFGAQE